MIFWFEITGFGSSSTLECGTSLKSPSDSSGESSTLNMILSKSSIWAVGISIVWSSNISGSWMLSSSLNDSRFCSFWFVGKPRIKAKLKKRLRQLPVLKLVPLNTSFDLYCLYLIEDLNHLKSCRRFFPFQKNKFG